MLAEGREIVIEEGVFIGGGVTILAGVRIGKYATIGAASVVTRVSPFCNIFFYLAPSSFRHSLFTRGEGGSKGRQRRGGISLHHKCPPC